MYKRVILLSLSLVAIVGLFSVEYNWGVKYGVGLSSIYGSDAAYNLHYDIRSIGATETSVGYLNLESDDADNGISHSFGAYFTSMLSKKQDSIWLQSELIWQRYNYTYKFQGRMLQTDNLMLANTFADTLNGKIKQTMDYITIPLLLKLKQDSHANVLDGHFDGAYIYFGPSLSVLVNNKSEKHRGVKALEDDIADFVADSYNDADATQAYASSRQESAGDKVLFHKTDLVFGMGFNIKNIFNMGIGKDEFNIDFRFNTGMYPVGDASTNTEFKLYSAMLSIGVKL
ncbi:MAG: hypothetical protein CVU50_01470 [Candidatus Cloacimonetes bacterium HGW-Cloacimonetes-3]|jgi:hypothetical protein|nr:MAG: hypothetical protein CVU50_01470 [Candidatus Cloacimonetes bacterium HGW-Cloacimonetes-3]